MFRLSTQEIAVFLRCYCVFLKRFSNFHRAASAFTSGALFLFLAIPLWLEEAIVDCVKWLKKWSVDIWHVIFGDVMRVPFKYRGQLNIVAAFFSAMCLVVVILVNECETVLVHKYGTKVVRTKYGALRGIFVQKHPPVELFLGVPYATPPVGSLRWEILFILN